MALVDFSGGARLMTRIQTTITATEQYDHFRPRTRVRFMRPGLHQDFDDSADVLPNQSRTKANGAGSPGTTESTLTLLTRENVTPTYPLGRTRMTLHPAENRNVGGSMPSLPIAPPQLDVAGPRSALGPCRSG